MHCAAAEVGQGVTNVILQVARTELGTDDVVLAPHTTATVGSAGSASASRMTWMAAGAVHDACRARRSRSGEPTGGGEVDVERIYRHPRTTPLDPETGQITGERAHVAFACAAMRVVAEVDVELGLTRVVWIGTAQDVGKAVNPQAVEGQIEGGTAQGLGLALMEEIQTRDGLITNASFTDYLIPTALDMPPVVAELIEEPEPDAPYGVKGVGEPPTVVSTAAVVAALRDATGRELTRVPGRAGRHLASSASERSQAPLARVDERPAGRRRAATEARSSASRQRVTGDLVLAEAAEAVDQRGHDEVAGDDDPDRRGDADPRRRDRDREDDEDAQRAAGPEPDRLVERRAEPAKLRSHDEEHAARREDERDDRREGERRDDRRRARRARPSLPPDRAGEPGDRATATTADGRSARHGAKLYAPRRPRRRRRRMVRVFVLYEEEPDADRYEQHAELCRKVPGGTFRHGKVFGAPMGEPAYRVLRRVGVRRTGTRSRRRRAATEFMATGKDAMEMGGRFHVLFADVDD